MNRRDLRLRADWVRAVPLEIVLRLRGAVRDRRDRSKWDTEQGPLSVTGSQFMNWRQGLGGGGAIDLVMHLGGLDFRGAVEWLEQYTAAGSIAAQDHALPSPAARPTVSLRHDLPRLPQRDDRLMGRMREYLAESRYLSSALLNDALAARP